MFYLRQSTASQEVPLGYFLDTTDGNTEETGLTIANTDIKVWKSGATSIVNKNSGGATHMSNGIYYATLDATDTNTVGNLVLFVNVADALSVRLECYVLEEDIFDALFDSGADAFDSNSRVDVGSWLGTAAATPTTAGVPEVDVTHISGDATAADNAESFFDGTGYAGTGNTIPTVTDVTNLHASAATSANQTTILNRLGAFTAVDRDWETALRVICGCCNS